MKSLYFDKKGNNTHVAWKKEKVNYNFNSLQNESTIEQASEERNEMKCKVSNNDDNGE